MAAPLNSMGFLNGPTPSSFFVYFWSFQINNPIFTTNQCENCPSSIRHWDSNPRPLKHEPSPITTRPRLSPKNNIVTTVHWNVTYNSRSHATAITTSAERLLTSRTSATPLSSSGKARPRPNTTSFGTRTATATRTWTGGRGSSCKESDSTKFSLFYFLHFNFWRFWLDNLTRRLQLMGDKATWQYSFSREKQI